MLLLRLLVLGWLQELDEVVFSMNMTVLQTDTMHGDTLLLLPHILLMLEDWPKATDKMTRS